MRKILLIEDDLALRITLKEILNLRHFEVLEAEHGQEALDVIEKYRPHLIMCDIMMPVMDGLEFHEIISKDSVLSAIPFIFLSAKQEENLMRKCLNRGADDFIRKPFIVDEIITIVETKLERFKKVQNAHTNLYRGTKKHFVHEVNTPLNDIIGIIKLLSDQQNTFLKQEIVELQKGIYDSADRLKRTMHNLFLYQEYSDNNLTFESPRAASIKATFLKVIQQLSKGDVYQETRISHTIQNAWVEVQNEYLEFILYALIDNALKFSQNNTVRVSGKITAQKYYELTIKDYGIGFTPEEVRNIHSGKQFNRKKLEKQGLGLGLFLSKKLTEGFGGILSIASKKNTSTTITLCFPIVEHQE